jgi:hypothetical protein
VIFHAPSKIDPKSKGLADEELSIPGDEEVSVDGVVGVVWF